MSQVHVIVTRDATQAEAWAAAFDGAIDLYHFTTRREAFQRLASASSPIAVLVLVDGDNEIFDMSAVQLAKRMVGSIFSASAVLGGMEVVLVAPGEQVASERVHHVGTMNAAIRLVKFGEAEVAPSTSMAAPVLPDVVPTRPAMIDLPEHDGGFAGSVISRIWDAADGAGVPTRRPQVAGGGGPARQQHAEAPVADSIAVPPAPAAPDAAHAAASVRMPRGTARMRPQASSAASLFAFAGDLVDAHEVGSAPVEESIAPSVRFHDATRARASSEYRGTVYRGNSSVSHHAVAFDPTADHPLPPHKQAQIQPLQPAFQPVMPQAVAPAVMAPVAVMGDPVLGFSSHIQRQLPSVTPMPQVAQMQQVAQMPQVVMPAHGLQAGTPIQLHPMQPAMAQAAAPAATPANLLARAEAGAASFG